MEIYSVLSNTFTDFIKNKWKYFSSLEKGLVTLIRPKSRVKHIFLYFLHFNMLKIRIGRSPESRRWEPNDGGILIQVRSDDLLSVLHPLGSMASVIDLLTVCTLTPANLSQSGVCCVVDCRVYTSPSDSNRLGSVQILLTGRLSTWFTYHQLNFSVVNTIVKYVVIN